jgi:hypothetical protein
LLLHFLRHLNGIRQLSTLTVDTLLHPDDDRAAREAMFQTLADELSAAPIQHIGKLLVLWRPMPEREKTVDEDRMPGPRDFKVLKYSKRGGQRPEVKTLRVLGNQRLTPGGSVKRAKKPKQRSLKKSAQD